jgi:microtubule-associated protein-like 6
MAQAGKAKCIDIFVWDIEKKEQVAHFNDFHLRAIVLLRFSPDGTLLLSVGQDDDNSLAIHDWQANRLIATSNIDKAKVNGAAWASNDEFCTVGNKHIKFWKLNGRNALGKMG